MFFDQLVLSLHTEFHTLSIHNGHARNTINGTEF